MKQVLQNLKTGATEVIELPCPRPSRGQLLVRTRASLLSAGTERMLVEFGKASLLGKAMQQPDKLRQAFEKARTDGVMATLAAVRNRLDQPLAPGYSQVGTVVGLGAGVSGFAIGDRVVSNGRHAEFVSVPVNLCAKVPDGVADEAAAFTVLGAIALQGLRLAAPTLGERFAVIGLGLIGLLTVQLLRAQGCRVLAIDLRADRLAIAERFGARGVDLSVGGDPLAEADRFTGGRGIDGVIIAASTASNDPVRQAARMSRKRGRIVLVGVAGLELSRADFYEKELSFQVSCSYGPGRHDPAYEDKGLDYPLPYVRWTEQRNFEAVLDMMADGRMDVVPLVTHRFLLDEAQKAYDLIASDAPHLGVLFEYRSEPLAQSVATPIAVTGSVQASPPVVGVVGAGNYASAVLLPALRQSGARLRALASVTGVSSAHQARRHGFESVVSDMAQVLSDAAINTVVIATRHDSHASLAAEALRAGRHVFVEKPLALSREQLDLVEAATAASPDRRLMVGFNRRFAPLVREMRERLANAADSKSILITVNAGAVPVSHWTQDPEIGGGRIVGEACHFIDLARHLAGSPIASVSAVGLGELREGLACADKASITLTFVDGSFAAIHYLANGHRSFPKERVEVFCGGRILQLDNFLRLRAWGWPGFRGARLWKQDKGNAACVAAFIRSVESGSPSPIPPEEIFDVSRATLEAGEQLRC